MTKNKLHFSALLRHSKLNCFRPRHRLVISEFVYNYPSKENTVFWTRFTGFNRTLGTNNRVTIELIYSGNTTFWFKTVLVTKCIVFSLWGSRRVEWLFDMLHNTVYGLNVLFPGNKERTITINCTTNRTSYFLLWWNCWHFQKTIQNKRKVLYVLPVACL